MGNLVVFKRQKAVGSAKQDLDQLFNELDEEFAVIAATELEKLTRLSKFTESVRRKLETHYARVFPKKCNTCGAVYMSYDEYQKATETLRKKSTIFDEAGLQEYRNCPCGSTLVLWTADRRDRSEYGESRRKLFDSCFQKLLSLSDEPRDLIQAKLRKVFSILAG